MKIAVNKCFGGFGLSTQAMKELIKINSPLVRTMTYSEYTGGREESIFDDDEWMRRGWKSVGDGFFTGAILEHVLYNEDGTQVWLDSVGYENRSHPDLIAVIETLGKDASGELAKLEIVDIPDGIEWEIDDYDGIETVEEQHRSW